MKKLNLFLTLVALTFATLNLSAKPAAADASGKLPGIFSIGGGKKAYFSQGNLQYIGSAATPYWKFAEQQYEYFGTTTGQNSASTTVDRDLFGWGTKTSPWNTSMNNADYSWNEWGENPISNGGNTANSGWRTLTIEQWRVLFYNRTPGNSVNGVSNARYTEATINTDGTEVNGLILFPDDVNLTTVDGVTWGTINSASDWSTKCTTAGWTALETAGCVFLPAAGDRSGTSVNDVGTYGIYSTPSSSSSTHIYAVGYLSSVVNLESGGQSKNGGKSVRLVKYVLPPATIGTIPTAKDPLTYTGSPLELLNAGSGVSGGTLKYSSDNSSWSTSIPTATDLGNYTVYWKVEGDASHSDIPSTPIEVSITVPTINDHSDAATINAVLALNPENLQVERIIVANGEYNTICLPFDVTASDFADDTYPLYGYERLKAFKGASVTGEGQDLYIDIFVEDVDHMDAGVPYLITYPADRGSNIVNPTFTGITVTTTEPDAVSANGVTFQGMFAQVHIDPYTSSAREQDFLFLGANSQLMWPSLTQTSSEIKMRGFRAYFIIDRNVITSAHAPKGTRARIMDAPKTTTGIDELNAVICTKLIENGQLYIIKNGVKYNAQGIIVK